RCAFGDEGVSSSRHNVASSVWRAARARAGTATASSKAVGNQDRVAKVNHLKRCKVRHTRTSARCCHPWTKKVLGHVRSLGTPPAQMPSHRRRDLSSQSMSANRESPLL